MTIINLFGTANYQPQDADLTAITGVSGTGLYARTASGVAAARQIAPGSGIAVSDGAGVSGDPTVSTDNASAAEAAAATSTTKVMTPAKVISYTEARGRIAARDRGVTGNGLIDDKAAMDLVWASCKAASGYTPTIEAGGIPLLASTLNFDPTVSTPLLINGPGIGFGGLRFQAAAVFSGDRLIQVKGQTIGSTASIIDFGLNNFAVVAPDPVGGVSGTSATYGLVIGEGSKSINGLRQSSNTGLFLNGFSYNFVVQNTRMQTFNGLSSWWGNVDGAVTALITLGSQSFCGDLHFNDGQLVGSPATGGKSWWVHNPYNYLSGTGGEIKGIRSRAMTYYPAATYTEYSWAAAGVIGDIWHDSCQWDGSGGGDFIKISPFAGAIGENFNWVSCYFRAFGRTTGAMIFNCDNGLRTASMRSFQFLNCWAANCVGRQFLAKGIDNLKIDIGFDETSSTTDLIYVDDCTGPVDITVRLRSTSGITTTPTVVTIGSNVSGPVFVNVMAAPGCVTGTPVVVNTTSGLVTVIYNGSMQLRGRLAVGKAARMSGATGQVQIAGSVETTAGNGVFSNLYYDGAWKFVENGGGAYFKGLSSGYAFSIGGANAVNASGANASATVAEWVYGGTDGKVRFLNGVSIGMSAAPGRTLDVLNSSRVSNSDWVNGSVGSALDFMLGASSGNTYSSVQAYTAGAAGAGVLALNPVAGNVSIGGTAADLKLNVAGSIRIEGSGANGLYLNGFTAATNPTIRNTTNNEITFRGSGGNTTNGIAYNFVKYDTAASFVAITQAGDVGVGTTTPATKLHVVGTGRFTSDLAVGYGVSTSTVILAIGGGRSGSGYAILDLWGDSSGTGLRLIRDLSGANANSFIQHFGTGALSLFAMGAGDLILGTNSTERVHIGATGMVGIGISSAVFGLDVETATYSVNFAKFGAALPVIITANQPGFGMNAYYNSGWKAAKGSSSSYGGYFNFNVTDAAYVWQISTAGANADASLTMAEAMRLTASYLRPGNDNTKSLGDASNRWTTVYAATGTINTSDARQKTPLTAIPAGVAAAMTTLFEEIGVYQWLTSINAKGVDGARKHIGVTAQAVRDAFRSAGEDPREWGLFCADETEDGEVFGLRYDQLFALGIAVLARNQKETMAA
ncbi:hypothetical protein sos41_11960 [Alphaproteobacteria bacterium SO-S41]|nr:hypothetical protein sos41_11960 [Alphaproteobacteria bacterium SO-S41]